MAEGEDGSVETVKLISADGHEFVVDRKCALVSGTIKSMLSGPGTSFLPYYRITHIHSSSTNTTNLKPPHPTYNK